MGQLVDGGCRPLVHDLFGNFKLVRTKAGDLRQMRNANHLVKPGKFGKFVAHHFCNRPADTGIHLVKDNGFHGIGLGENGL